MLSTPEKLDVWADAAVPYAPECPPAGCKTLRVTGLTHGGGPDDSAAAAPPRIVYNPNIDDAVAQWGDCLQSILTCVRAEAPGEAASVDNCVDAAACPQACKERYQSASGGDFERAQAALFSVFVETDAVCRPEDTQ